MPGEPWGRWGRAGEALPLHQGKVGRARGERLLLSQVCAPLTARSGSEGSQAQGFRLPTPAPVLQSQHPLTHSRGPGGGPKPPGDQVGVGVRGDPGGGSFEVAAARCFLITLQTALQKGALWPTLWAAGHAEAMGTGTPA